MVIIHMIKPKRTLQEVLTPEYTGMSLTCGRDGTRVHFGKEGKTGKTRKTLCYSIHVPVLTSNQASVGSAGQTSPSQFAK